MRDYRPSCRRHRPRRGRGHPDEVGVPEGAARDRRAHAGRPRHRRGRAAPAPSTSSVVVRHEREQVAAHVAEVAPDAVIAVQDEAEGTGHAVRVRAGRPAGRPRRHRGRDVRRRPAAATRETLRGAASRRTTPSGSAVTVLTADGARPDRLRPDPARRRRRRSTAIVEEKDADRRAAGDPRDQLRRSTPSTPPCLRDALAAARPPTTPRARSTSPTSSAIARDDGLAGRRATLIDDAAGRPRASTTGSSSPSCGAELNRRIVERLDARRASPSSTRPPPGSTST